MDMSETAKETLKASYHICICLIEIWRPKKPLDVSSAPENPILLTDVGEASINDSFRNLCSSAKIVFPRGSVVRKTIARNDGSELKVTAGYDDIGVLSELRDGAQLMKVDTFASGDRIKIYLGYTTDPAISALTKARRGKKSVYNSSEALTQYKKALGEPMFDGFITDIGMEESIELSCSDLLWSLNKITCPPVTAERLAINDFLAEDGTYKLLKNTGIKLHPATKAHNIELGKVTIPEGMTAAEVIGTWAKKNIVAFLSYYNGEPCLSLGRSFFTRSDQGSVLYYNPKSEVSHIEFDYHVADNKLKAIATDKRYLAIDASAFTPDGQTMKVLVCMSDNPRVREYRVLSKSTTSKKAIKFIGRHAQEADLPKSMYKIIPFIADKWCRTYDDLVALAINYYESADLNGAQGKLVIFGDLALRSKDLVHLNDKRSPQKNGVYVVDQVDTVFGTRGFRQTLSIPHCIQRDGVINGAAVSESYAENLKIEKKPANFKLSQPHGYDFVKSFEGLRLTGYLCVGKVATIGYGYTGLVKGNPIIPGKTTITEEEADELFVEEVKEKEAILNQELSKNGIYLAEEKSEDEGRSANVELAKDMVVLQNEYDALFSLMYNVGSSALFSYNLFKKYVKMVTGGKEARTREALEDIAKEFLDINKADGTVQAGLTRRREAEYRIFLDGIYNSLNKYETEGDFFDDSEFFSPNDKWIPADRSEILANLHEIENNLMNPVRVAFGYPIIVTNAYRSPTYNSLIGGSATSAHTTGRAWDVVCGREGDIRYLFKAIVDVLTANNIAYDQLIWETPAGSTSRWIHISLKNNGGESRGQILQFLGKGRYVSIKENDLWKQKVGLV